MCQIQDQAAEAVRHCQQSNTAFFTTSYTAGYTGYNTSCLFNLHTDQVVASPQATTPWWGGWGLIEKVKVFDLNRNEDKFHKWAQRRETNDQVNPLLINAARVKVYCFVSFPISTGNRPRPALWLLILIMLSSYHQFPNLLQSFPKTPPIK